MDVSSHQPATTWQPERFNVGDLVIDPNVSEWGIGRVVKDQTYARSPTCGQRIIVDFPGRGLVMVFTAIRILRKVNSDGLSP
jgi:hypothetical protein